MTQIRLIIDRQEDACTANCYTREGCSVEKRRLLGNCHPREGGDPLDTRESECDKFR